MSSTYVVFVLRTPHACVNPPPPSSRYRRQRLRNRMKSEGLRASPWGDPRVTWTFAVSPYGVLTFTQVPAWARLMVSTSPVVIPRSSRRSIQEFGDWLLGLSTYPTSLLGVFQYSLCLHASFEAVVEKPCQQFVCCLQQGHRSQVLGVVGWVSFEKQMDEPSLPLRKQVPSLQDFVQRRQYGRPHFRWGRGYELVRDSILAWGLVAWKVLEEIPYLRLRHCLGEEVCPVKPSHPEQSQ
eukprot:3933422-Rhodomonas_salina.3